MKIILGAIALTFALPAFGQAAPAPAAHADHKAMDHGKHHGEKHDCKECCEKMKQQDGKMECMDKKDGAKEAAPSAPQDHQAHSGHAH